MSNQGTPQTLKEAIRKAIMSTPLDESDVTSPAIIRDYMSQKFTIAYLKASTPEVVSALDELWESLTQESTIKSTLP